MEHRNLELSTETGMQPVASGCFFIATWSESKVQFAWLCPR